MVLKISLATWDHDRVTAIHDGRVVVPGVEIDGHILPTTKLFPIAVQEARFDITERSVSSYVLQVSRGTSAYTAIPAFVSRAFRHNGFFRARRVWHLRYCRTRWAKCGCLGIPDDRRAVDARHPGR